MSAELSSAAVSDGVRQEENKNENKHGPGIRRYFKGVSIDCIMTCLYFACLPFTVVTTPMGMSVLKLITYPVVAVLGLRLFIGNTKPIRLNIVHAMYTVYVIYTFSQLFYYRAEISVTNTKDMLLILVAMLLITMRVYNDNEKRLIESTWVLVGLICIYLIVFQSMSLNQYESRKIIKIFGFEEDPNYFCMYFVMPILICIKRIISKSKLLLFYLAEALLILYSVFQTGSRGGLIGVLVGVFFAVILAIRGAKAKVAFIVTGILAAVIVTTVIFPMLPEDIQERYTIEDVVESRGTGRFDTWEYAIEYTSENPIRLLKGSGLMSTYEIFSYTDRTDSGFAHNQLIQVLFDQGLIGLIIYLILIAACILRNIKNEPYTACAFISAMAFSMSLTIYVLKPYINILMMCAMNYEYEQAGVAGEIKSITEGDESDSEKEKEKDTEYEVAQ